MPFFDIYPTAPYSSDYPLRRIHAASAEEAFTAFLAEHGGAGVKRTGPTSAVLLGEVTVEAREAVDAPEPPPLFAHKRTQDGRGWRIGQTPIRVRGMS
jgi:hypothetical protein